MYQNWVTYKEKIHLPATYDKAFKKMTSDVDQLAVLVWEYESRSHYPRTCVPKLPKHNLSALVKTVYHANPSEVVGKLETIRSRADLLQTLQSNSYNFFEYASE